MVFCLRGIVRSMPRSERQSTSPLGTSGTKRSRRDAEIPFRMEYISFFLGWLSDLQSTRYNTPSPRQVLWRCVHKPRTLVDRFLFVDQAHMRSIAVTSHWPQTQASIRRTETHPRKSTERERSLSKIRRRQESRYCEGRYRNRYHRFGMLVLQGTFHKRETLLGMQIYPEST